MKSSKFPGTSSPFAIDLSGDEFSGDARSVGRPAQASDCVAEGFRAARDFFAIQNFAAAAVGFENPNVVALHLKFLKIENVARGIGETAVGCVCDGGAVVVNGNTRSGRLLCARRNRG